MLICPESPAWLVLKLRRREAEAVAEKLWGADGLAQLGAGAHRAGAVLLPAATASSRGSLQGVPRLHPTAPSCTIAPQ